MLFIVAAHLAPGSEGKRKALSSAFSDHLGQRTPRVRLGGYMKNAEDGRELIMLLIEAEHEQAAQAFLHASPYYQAELYDRIDIGELVLEVGTLD